MRAPGTPWRGVQVDPRRLVAHLERIVGERHPVTSPGHLSSVESYVRNVLADAGYAVTEHAFSSGGHAHRNLVADRPGSAERPDPLFVVGAHLDSVAGTPGADDNASGVAAMLELARLLAVVGPSRWRWQFVGFALEEWGMLGARAYVGHLRAGRRRVAGMLSLEMLAFTEREGYQHYPPGLGSRYPATGEFIGVVANSRSRALARCVAEGLKTQPGLPVETLIVPCNGHLLPATRLSDQSPFWDAGYPAAMITDTAFLRNPHYHQPSDTLDTLDIGFLVQVTQGLAAALAGRVGT